MWDEQLTEAMYAVISESLAPIMHLETEWDADKLQKKLGEYLGKAGKSVAKSKAWKQKIVDFADKFFETMWRALGEREWLDQVDWTPMIAKGIAAYSPELASETDEFHQAVVDATEAGFDSSRYYSWSWQVLKNVVTGKIAQKKVREAIDNAREEVRSQWPPTPELFVSNWVLTTITKLGDPTDVLHSPMAENLFKCMVEHGGGLPLVLEMQAGGKTESMYAEIPSAVALAYQAFPNATSGSLGGSGPFFEKSSTAKSATHGGWAAHSYDGGSGKASGGVKGSWSALGADPFGAKGAWGADSYGAKGGWGADLYGMKGALGTNSYGKASCGMKGAWGGSKGPYGW